MRFFLLAFLYVFLNSGLALGEQESDYLEMPDSSELVYDDEFKDPSYPGDDIDRFRCELVIVIVNLNNRFERKRHSIFAGGRSWSESRGRVFQEYGRWIGQNRFFKTQFQHSFYFNDCF